MVKFKEVEKLKLISLKLSTTWIGLPFQPLMMILTFCINLLGWEIRASDTVDRSLLLLKLEYMENGETRINRLSLIHQIVRKWW